MIKESHMSENEERLLALPEELPVGENVLWQGQPDFRSSLKRLFLLPHLLFYFLLLFISFFLFETMEYGLKYSVVQLASNLLLAGLAVVLFMGLCYLTVTTTKYTLTDKRLVMRVGIVLTVTFNIPYKKISSADHKVYSDGTGDISVDLTPPNKIAYVHLWPHCRPFHFGSPRPRLTCISEVEKVAKVFREFWEKRDSRCDNQGRED